MTTNPLPRAPHLRIQVPTAAKQVSDTLRELILRGEMPPGTAIEEAPTAESFGVSRNTVREAIRDLARAGLVVQNRLRPAVVVSLTADAVEDIFRVRMLLEVASARMIAERAGGDEAEPRQVTSALAQLAAVQETSDWHRQAEADLGFHTAIVESTGSDRLLRGFEMIGSEVMLCLGLTDRWDTDPVDQMRQHRAILDRLAARDPDGAEALLRAHIGDARTRVLSVLQRAEQAGS